MTYSELGTDDKRFALLTKHAPSGVKMDNRYMLFLKRSRETILLAVIEGLENIPPRDYSKGVNIAFGYIDIPGQPKEMPPDFYLIRGTVRDSIVGFTDGVVEFFNKDMCCVGSLPARFRIFSRDIPSDPPGSGIEISGSLGSLSLEDENQAAPPDDGGLYVKCHTNGLYTCYRWWIDKP